MKARRNASNEKRAISLRYRARGNYHSYETFPLLTVLAYPFSLPLGVLLCCELALWEPPPPPLPPSLLLLLALSEFSVWMEEVSWPESFESA